MNFGEFLQKMFEFLTRWLPRYRIVPATHGGVAFVRGKHKREIRPGLCWYWPVWTELTVMPLAAQVLNLQNQALVMRRGKQPVSVVVGAILEYEVRDPVKAFGERYNLDDSIKNLALMAVKETFWNRPLTTIVGNLDGFEAKLKRALSGKLRRYGVRVLSVGLSDFAACKVYKFMAEEHIVPAAVVEE